MNHMRRTPTHRIELGSGNVYNVRVNSRRAIEIVRLKKPFDNETQIEKNTRTICLLVSAQYIPDIAWR